MLKGFKDFKRIEEYETTIKNVTSFSNAKKVKLLLEDGTIKEYENALLRVEQGDVEYYLDGYVVFKGPTKVKIEVFRDPIAKIVKYVRISIL